MNSFRNSVSILRRTILLQNSTRELARRVYNPTPVKVYDKTANKSNSPVLPWENIKDDSEDVIWNDEEINIDIRNKHKPKKNIKPNNDSKIVDKYEKSSSKTYEKSDEHSKNFRKIMTNMAIKKRRDEMNKVVLEGIRLINDAIDSKIPIESIYFSDESHLSEIHDLDRLVQLNGTKLVKVLYHDMKVFTSLVQSPGCMAVADKPSAEFIMNSGVFKSEVPLTIICDNVRDPNNLGTIIRTGAASGIQKILTTIGCCDVWNTKVLKSSSGAHFHVPIYDKIEWENIPNFLSPLEENEFFISDSNLTSESKSYFELNEVFNSDRPQNKVLIVSNEAHGISPECQKLMAKISNYNRIHIPLGSNVESLSAAVTASILMFELRKQFFLKKPSY